jgi:hypothetical protein
VQELDERRQRVVRLEHIGSHMHVGTTSV